jgi:hypothetical protein
MRIIGNGRLPSFAFRRYPVRLLPELRSPLALAFSYDGVPVGNLIWLVKDRESGDAAV